LAAFVAVRDRSLATDDSYIHRRIAEHYASTGFAWWNAGERVMGTSSPLWTILLALLFKISARIDIALPLLEAVLVGIASGLAASLAGRLCQPALGKPENNTREVLAKLGAGLVTGACLLDSAVGQMETPLAICLLLGGLRLLSGREKPWHLNGRATLGLALLVLATLTRLELGLYVLLLATALIISKRATLLTFAAGLATALIGCLWMLHQFGTVVPNTIAAKSAAYTRIPVVEVLRCFNMSRLGAVLFAALLICLIATVWRNQRDDVSAAAISLTIGGAALGMLYVFRGVLVFPWYIPLVTVPLGLGIWLIAATSRNWQVQAVSLLLFLWVLRFGAGADKHLTFEAITGHTPGDGLRDLQAARVHEYLLLGSSLNTACSNGTLLTSEIGGLGYSYHGKVLDGLGLVTPEAIAYHPLRFPEDSPTGTEGAIPPRFARATLPDLIVTYYVWGEATIREGREMNYTEFIIPPFPEYDYAPANSYLGPMYVMVRGGDNVMSREFNRL
jgi:hypothetical protein